MKVNKLVLICLFAWLQIVAATDKNRVLLKFQEYLELRYSLGEATPEDLKGQLEKISEIKSEILSFDDHGIEVLLDRMATADRPRRKTEVIRFFDQANLKDERILSAVRSLTRSQKLDELKSPVLLDCLEYLGNHGTQEDIELLESFNAHNSQGIPRFVKLAIQKIEKRERGEKPDKPSGPPPEAKAKPDTPTPEPTFAKKPTEPEADDDESISENPFANWFFLIGGIVILGLVITVLFRRR